MKVESEGSGELEDVGISVLHLFKSKKGFKMAQVEFLSCSALKKKKKRVFYSLRDNAHQPIIISKRRRFLVSSRKALLYTIYQINRYTVWTCNINLIQQQKADKIVPIPSLSYYILSRINKKPK